MHYDILFAIMAVQEVVFFIPIAKRLRDEVGLNVAFLTFHEAGDDILEREGITSFSLHKIKRTSKRNVINDTADIEKKLGVGIEHLIFHEMHTSGRHKRDLISKAANYYSIFNNILKTNNIGCIVQELGGFIAPLTLYYVSRENNINHVFIEPAMFRKRIVFTLNNLYADIPDYRNKNLAMSEELKQLLSEYMTQKTVVIPKKDRHFFQDMTFRRLFSSDNFRRLSRKLYHKYVLGREEEYNWILQYINMHIVKAFRRKILSFYYTNPVEGEKYIYYPFHVPLDVQLTARCPEFFDQENLVRQIADCLPQDYKLYIKEHPAAIGGHSLSKLKRALKSNRNIRLIHPGHNSYDIIKNASCIITVNSKVGVEAIMQGKPVVVLGKTFYRGKGVTIDVDNLSGISEAIARAINYKPDMDEARYFLNYAFQWSFKGELYENSRENVDNFYQSLRSFMSESQLIPTSRQMLESTIK
jgi:capsule polysaccharide modification protein KpsS